MKRDMDLIKHLLEEIENAGSPINIENFDFTHYSQEEVYYHLRLLAGAGYIDASFEYADNSLYFGSVSGLTWDGQDFLDVARSDKVWQKSKKIVKDAVGTTSFEVIKETCKSVALGFVKSQIG